MEPDGPLDADLDGQTWTTTRSRWASCCSAPHGPGPARANGSYLPAASTPRPTDRPRG